MVTREEAKPKAPEKKKPPAEPEGPPGPDAERKKRLQEALRREQAAHSQGYVKRSSFVPEPPKGVVNTQGVLKSKEQLEKEEEDELLKEFKKKEELDQGCPDDDPCEPKKEINLDLLAEKVFQMLMFEARIERERVGWKV